jgi:hypothetical protein
MSSSIPWHPMHELWPLSPTKSAIKQHLYNLSLELSPIGWPGEATMHLSDLARGLGMSTRPQKVGLVNIMA